MVASSFFRTMNVQKNIHPRRFFLRLVFCFSRVRPCWLASCKHASSFCLVWPAAETCLHVTTVFSSFPLASNAVYTAAARTTPHDIFNDNNTAPLYTVSHYHTGDNITPPLVRSYHSIIEVDQMALPPSLYRITLSHG